MNNARAKPGDRPGRAGPEIAPGRPRPPHQGRQACQRGRNPLGEAALAPPADLRAGTPAGDVRENFPECFSDASPNYLGHRSFGRCRKPVPTVSCKVERGPLTQFVRCSQNPNPPNDQRFPRRFRSLVETLSPGSTRWRACLDQKPVPLAGFRREDTRPNGQSGQAPASLAHLRHTSHFSTNTGSNTSVLVTHRQYCEVGGPIATSPPARPAAREPPAAGDEARPPV